MSLKNMTDFLELIKKQKDKRRQYHLLFKIIQKSLQDKYEDSDIEVKLTDDTYDPMSGLPVSFACFNKDGMIVESFTELQGNAFNVNVVQWDGEKLKITDDAGLERIWNLYLSVTREISSDKSSETLEQKEEVQIPVNKIKPNPNQIRVNFDDVEFVRTSFTEIGQRQPIEVIRKTENTDEFYQIIDGEKRWRAAKELGWKTIRAFIVKEDEDIDDISMASNFARSEPNAIALAKWIAQKRLEVKETNCWSKRDTNIIPEKEFRLLDKKNIFLSHPEIDKRIERKWGIKAKRQQKLVELLKLHPEFQNKVAQGDFNISEDIYTVNLDKDDFSSEFIKAVQENLRKDRLMSKIEKNAKNLNDPNSKFLSYYKWFESFPTRIDLSSKYIDKVDERTYESVRERGKKFINYLMNKLNIDINELEEES